MLGLAEGKAVGFPEFRNTMGAETNWPSHYRFPTPGERYTILHFLMEGVSKILGVMFQASHLFQPQP